MKLCIYISVLFVFSGPVISAQEVSFKGQLNSWLSVNHTSDFKFRGGLRYIPSLNIEKQSGKIKYDTEISVNTYGTLDYYDGEFEPDGKFKPYRLWLRMSAEQYELRAGLQKLNFGSASMLRPLMWFDRLDPRDPLQLTDGVYALLGRYYFINNANIWLWILYGNKNTKGWESVPVNRKKPEYGGRLQVPALKGEVALSYHYREADYSQVADSALSLLNNTSENRLGFDGRWDIGIGFWFESMLLYQDIPEKHFPWQEQLNLGFDYTFDIGNGLNIINEFLWASASRNIFQSDNRVIFSALALRYPVGLLDNITGMVYYDWTNDGLYRFINWQRQYDNISLYLMLFWNPDEFNIYRNIDGTDLFTGKGVQLMFVLNH